MAVDAKLSRSLFTAEYYVARLFPEEGEPLNYDADGKKSRTNIGRKILTIQFTRNPINAAAGIPRIGNRYLQIATNRVIKKLRPSSCIGHWSYNDEKMNSTRRVVENDTQKDLKFEKFLDDTNRRMFLKFYVQTQINKKMCRISNKE